MKKTILSFLLLVLALIKNTYAQSIANYDILVTTIWNSTDHSSVPSNAHWSNLVGATHKNANEVISFGEIAPSTNGLKDVAEFGSNSNFQNEINNLINNGNADQFFRTGFSPNNGDNDIATLNNITVSEAFPYVTLASMVAPSPDWFIAVNSENLRSGDNSINDGWKETYTINMYAYDAGTDSGTNYGSANLITNPRAPIALITGFPINGNPMATITFTYKTSTTLHINPERPLDRLQIFNDPATKNIVISNIDDSDLNSISLYNILGHLIQQVPIYKQSSSLKLDVSHLNSGMYVLKTVTKTGVSKTIKLIIN